MVDQRAKFSPLGLTVEFVGEAQEDRDAVRRVIAGKVQLVYLSPEAILSHSLGCYLKLPSHEHVVQPIKIKQTQN